MRIPFQRFCYRYRPYFLADFLFRADQREQAKRFIESSWQEKNCCNIFKITGNSMGAALPEGSVVTVMFAKNPRLSSRKLIYIRKGKTRIIHRLIGVFGPFILERGDSNEHFGIFHKSSAIGVVTHIEHPFITKN